MTTPQLEQLRINLLLQLEAAGTHGLQVTELLVGANIQRFGVDAGVIQHEVDYLVSRELVAEKAAPSVIGHGRKFYRIAPNGRDFLAEHNFRPTT